MSHTTKTNEFGAQLKNSVRLLLVLLALLVAVVLLPTQDLQALQEVAHYLPVHMVMESVAVIIAAMVYVVGWHTYQVKTDYRMLAVACLFLGVAVLDFTHMLSFEGMPEFVTPAGPEKSIVFWLAARTFAAAAMLCVVILPRKAPGMLGRYLILSAVLLALIFIHIWFLFFPQMLPTMFNADSGLSSFKIIYEFCLILVFTLAAVLLVRIAVKNRAKDTLMLAVSAAVMALSEIFFSIYSSINDIYNLFGHLYKIIAFGYLYRSLVVSGIDAPFVEIESLGKRIRATLDALPDMMFELSGQGVILKYHSSLSQPDLMAHPEEFEGRNFSEFLPEEAADVCRLAMSDIDHTGRSSARQYSLMTKTGLRWFEISGAGMTTPEGDSRYIFVIRDISQRISAERALQRSERILKAALDHLPVGVAINSIGGEIHFEYMNEKFPLFYRTSREALMYNGPNSEARFWETIFEDPAQREAIRQRVNEDYLSGDPSRLRWENVPLPRGSQELRYVSAQNVEVPEEQLVVSIVTDVTENLKTDSELRIAATAFASQEGIMITDARSRILRVNKSFERTTGYTQDEVIGKNPSWFSSGRHDAGFYKTMWDCISATGAWHGEIWNRRKSGEIYPQMLTISAVRDDSGEITNYVGDFIDISDLKYAEQEISRLSYYDSLTGLPNRDKLLDLIGDSIAQCESEKRRAALLIIDLDNFKTINETMGHEAGDRLLVLVAERLQRIVDRADQIARYGGDEFVMLINNLDARPATAAATVQQKAQSVLAAIEDYYVINGARYYTSSSIGVTLFSMQSATSGELMKQADIALFQAKEAGRNQVSFFDPELEAAISDRAWLLAGMRDGIHLGQFELYLQPQQDVSGVITGAEALVRWNHPIRGLVPPDEFIPLAESSGLMLPLGKEIVRMGLTLLQSWQQREDCRRLKLSLNLSSQQFHEPDFAAELITELDERKLDADKLMLEFTESTLLDNFSQARLNMQKLSSKGVGFAIDDFGTGYSSLAYLSELPLDQLKIDKSFVRNMSERHKDRAIVRTIIDMAYSMGMEVLAEGVETEEQREYLRAQGCNLYQGYLIGKPRPAGEFLDLIRKESPGSSA